MFTRDGERINVKDYTTENRSSFLKGSVDDYVSYLCSCCWLDYLFQSLHVFFLCDVDLSGFRYNRVYLLEASAKKQSEQDSLS
ncbi:hypothetical protein GCM10010916_48230 [Paenibacillus abyssi]|uniref:Uncharacterized protein n=1 Tax=Paenibacillus abyssi TaxID=1340531 RepID=A0A917LI79_9BACL|nr:hypothetical protein GCM10010916_48230 [Paenibacillus abyssi]